MILNDLRLSYHDTVSGVDFQKKLKIHAAHPRRSILAAWILNFLVTISDTVRLYSTVYTLLYIQYCRTISLDFQKKCSRGAGRYGGGTARRKAREH